MKTPTKPSIETCLALITQAKTLTETQRAIDAAQKHYTAEQLIDALKKS